MKFSERVTELTYNEILPNIVDLVNNSNILTSRVMSKPQNWKGKTISQPVRIANSTTGSSFDGLDEFDTSTTNNVRSLTWYVKGYVQPIVMSSVENAINGAGDKKAISLLATQLDETKDSVIDALGDQLYGYGVGKDIEGLGLITDNGTATSSYGGVSRASLPLINGDTTAAAGGTLSLDLVSAEFDNVSAAGISKDAPTIAYTTKAVWSLFEKLMNSKLTASYNPVSINGYNRVTGKTPVGVSVPASSLKGAFGADSISYRGKNVVADDKCPSGVFHWMNEHYLDFYRLIDPDLKQISSKIEVTENPNRENQQPSFLQMRDFLSPVNQLGKVAALVVLGNLIHRNPRRNGKITGITKIA